MKVCHYKQSLKLRHIKPQHSLWWLNPSQPKINQATQLKILDLRLFLGQVKAWLACVAELRQRWKTSNMSSGSCLLFFENFDYRLILLWTQKTNKHFIKLVWQMIISYHKFGKYVVLLNEIKGNRSLPATMSNSMIQNHHYTLLQVFNI